MSVFSLKMRCKIKAFLLSLKCFLFMNVKFNASLAKPLRIMLNLIKRSDWCWSHIHHLGWVTFLFCLIFSSASRADWNVFELAEMPYAISNNAVTSANVNGNWFVCSFSGIDTTKVWSGISNRSMRKVELVPSSDNPYVLVVRTPRPSALALGI